MKLTRSIATAALACAVLAAPVAFSNQFVSLDAGAALAKGNGGGNGGGNGSGGGNGNGGGASAGSNAGGNSGNGGKSSTAGANGRSANSQAARTNFNGGSLGPSQSAKSNFNNRSNSVASTKANIESANKHGKLVGKERAVWAREFAASFKGLNAHRASAQAYASASLDSQVGAINAYAMQQKEALAAQQVAETERAELATILGLESLTDDQVAALEAALADLSLTTEETTQIAGLLGVEPSAISSLNLNDVSAALTTLSEAEDTLTTEQAQADEAWGAAAKQGQDDDVRAELDNRLEARGFFD